jgi:hypothetical protein
MVCVSESTTHGFDVALFGRAEPNPENSAGVAAEKPYSFQTVFSAMSGRTDRTLQTATNEASSAVKALFRRCKVLLVRVMSVTQITRVDASLEI